MQTSLEILRENEVSVCIQGEGTFSSRENIIFKGMEHSGHGTIVPQSCENIVALKQTMLG